MKIKNKVLLTLGLGAALGTGAASAQIDFSDGTISGQIAPLTGFGTGGSGWQAPNGTDGSTFTYLTANSVQRGLAYGDGDLFLVQDSGSIDILNPTTGGFLGTLNNSGITGGTFGADMVAVGGDGTVYVGNLTASATVPFTVYKWTAGNFSSAPTVAYSGNPLGGGTRLGDSLAAIGSGNSTMLVAGYGTGASGYEIINPSANSATAIAFTGSPPTAGNFKLGLAFTDSSHVIGTAGGGIARDSAFSGTTGTLLASPALSGTADVPLGYISVGGYNIMVTTSTGDNHVTLYDMANPGSPTILEQSANNTTGTLASNGNQTGDVTFGPVTDNPDGTYTFDVYTMSTGDGIQAFQVVIAPEPSTYALAMLGAGSLLLWRRRGGH